MSILYKNISVRLPGVTISDGDLLSMEQSTARRLIKDLQAQLKPQGGSSGNRATRRQIKSAGALLVETPRSVSMAVKVRQYLQEAGHVILWDYDSPRNKCALITEDGKARLNAMDPINITIEEILVRFGSGGNIKCTVLLTEDNCRKHGFPIRYVKNGYGADVDIREQFEALGRSNGINSKLSNGARLSIIHDDHGNKYGEVLCAVGIHHNNGPTHFLMRRATNTVTHPSISSQSAGSPIFQLLCHQINADHHFECYNGYRLPQAVIVLDGEL